MASYHDLIINAETFIADEVQTRSWKTGTVECSLGRETKRLPASIIGEMLTAHGFTAKYYTGKKLWPASVTSRIDQRTGKRWESVDFGRDERSGRCRKVQHVWFAKD
jgi:hypothetical protein